LDFGIDDDGWLFKFANRDLTHDDTMAISDAFCVHCEGDLWHLNVLDTYFRSPTSYRIKDIAYEQNEDCIYVLFSDDNHLYRFDHPSIGQDSRKCVLLVKESASMKIETFSTVQLQDGSP